MFKTFKKQDGFMHLSLIIAIAAVIVVVGIVGSRVVSKSDAASYSNKWGACYLNDLSFYVTPVDKQAATIDRLGVGYVSSKGGAVKYYYIEIGKFAKKRFDGQKGYLSYKYNRVDSKVWRTATFSAYCPNAKNPNTGSHWKTEVRGAWQYH